ncbi:MAG: preprotein translocase subunit SecE [Actinobacteria bacterium]|nr:MAG: preprotein translocase subunit SecE [Actinomycetota bacterium]
MQAAQLPDEQVEAKHARPVRGEEVLPLVRPAHDPPGDSLGRWPGRPVRGGASSSARTFRRQPRPRRSAAGQPKSQTGTRREPRGGIRAFTAESWGELKKVEWPGRRQLVSATVVVIIAVAVVGAYLFLADQVFKWLVKHVLLNL